MESPQATEEKWKFKIGDRVKGNADTVFVIAKISKDHYHIYSDSQEKQTPFKMEKWWMEEFTNLLWRGISSHVIFDKTTKSWRHPNAIR